jgi:hypothetical protein
MRYSLNTFLELDSWSRYERGAAICSDGKVRSLRFTTGLADTFFSVPCSVQVRGKTVSGFCTVETEEGLSADTDSDPLTVKFIAYSYGRNAEALPAGAWKRFTNSALHALRLATSRSLARGEEPITEQREAPKEELAWRDGSQGRATISNAAKEAQRKRETEQRAKPSAEELYELAQRLTS